MVPGVGGPYHACWCCPLSFRALTVGGPHTPFSPGIEGLFSADLSVQVCPCNSTSGHGQNGRCELAAWAPYAPGTRLATSMLVTVVQVVLLLLLAAARAHGRAHSTGQYGQGPTSASNSARIGIAWVQNTGQGSEQGTHHRAVRAGANVWPQLDAQRECRGAKKTRQGIHQPAPVLALRLAQSWERTVPCIRLLLLCSTGAGQLSSCWQLSGSPPLF